MTTVAEIASRAFTKVEAKVAGIIAPATLTRTLQGAYDPFSGGYTTTTVTATGRALFDTSTKIEDAMPGYVAGPSELLAWVEGLSFTPKENDAIAIGGTDYTVKAVGDIVGAGSFFACAVVKN